MKSKENENKHNVYLKYKCIFIVPYCQALGNLYFIEKSIERLSIWNFLTHEWEVVEGKSIHTGNIEAVATKEKAKFPQHFFPEVICRLPFLSIYYLNKFIKFYLSLNYFSANGHERGSYEHDGM